MRAVPKASGSIPAYGVADAYFWRVPCWEETAVQCFQVFSDGLTLIGLWFELNWMLWRFSCCKYICIILMLSGRLWVENSDSQKNHKNDLVTSCLSLRNTQYSVDFSNVRLNNIKLTKELSAYYVAVFINFYMCTCQCNMWTTKLFNWKRTIVWYYLHETSVDLLRNYIDLSPNIVFSFAFKLLHNYVS